MGSSAAWTGTAANVTNTKNGRRHNIAIHRKETGRVYSMIRRGTFAVKSGSMRNSRKLIKQPNRNVLISPREPVSADPPPIETVRPATVTELGDVVRRAAENGLGLFPRGGGTHSHIGYAPAKPGFAVDMTAMDQVIDYPARDMTITVQAGITLAKLQAILAAENQRLPIDVAEPERATLGGAIAVNASGPRRFGFGTLRDYVIGISFTNDEGNEVKAGGRVVKNVAGYDLCKLQIGAFGTLGIITQVTLKLKPLPEDA